MWHFIDIAKIVALIRQKRRVKREKFSYTTHPEFTLTIPHHKNLYNTLKVLSDKHYSHFIETAFRQGTSR